MDKIKFGIECSSIVFVVVQMYAAEMIGIYVIAGSCECLQDGEIEETGYFRNKTIEGNFDLKMHLNKKQNMHLFLN